MFFFNLKDHPSSDSFYDSDNAEPENAPTVDEDEAPDVEVDGQFYSSSKIYSYSIMV